MRKIIDLSSCEQKRHVRYGAGAATALPKAENSHVPDTAQPRFESAQAANMAIIHAPFQVMEAFSVRQHGTGQVIFTAATKPGAAALKQPVGSKSNSQLGYSLMSVKQAATCNMR
ncbi:hypothetical protein WJX77_010319 [Trebouxia sp. C0004]